MTRPNVRITKRHDGATACPLVHIADQGLGSEVHGVLYWTICGEFFDRYTDVKNYANQIARDVDEPATCLKCLGEL